MYRRDLDLIRKLLLQTDGLEKPDLSAYEKDQICHHYELLIDAGYVQGKVAWGRNDAGNGVTCRSMVITRLTWDGRAFLDSARDRLIWHTALASLGERAATIPLAELIRYLQSLVKQRWGLP